MQLSIGVSWPGRWGQPQKNPSGW